jgi:hypothetical protein
MTATQLTAKPGTENWPLDKFKVDQGQIDRHDDPEEIRLRGQDMLARGQLQAVGATEDGRLIFGHGRWLAAKAAGIKTLEVKVFPASLPDTQFKLVRASENLQRKELTGHKTWLLCSELMCSNPDWELKDLAKHLGKDASWATRIMCLSKCIPEWQSAFKDGKVGISDCYAASKLPEKEQAGLLALKLSGASRDAIEQAGRKQRNGNAPAVRLSRVRIAMPQGATVVVSGNGLDLPGVVELLTETLKEARKAAEQYDVSTWVRMMRDRAKAG